MSTARKRDLISVDQYLNSEIASPIKNEYVAGAVYAMTGGTVAHSIISTNALALLRNQLADSSCREYNSDMKVRIRTPQGLRFYYPDAQVVCQSNPQTESFQDSPVLIVEVLSDSTRRIDEEEKRDAYLNIPSLNVYILLEQRHAHATVYHRTETGFERLVFDNLDSTIKSSDPSMSLPLHEIYRDIEFEV